MSPDKIAAICFSTSRQAQAREFCERHKLTMLKKDDGKHELLLRLYDDIIELYDCQLNTAISVDFLGGSLAHRQQFGGGRGQAIAKAAGLKAGITPSILDATAGLAGDAFVLATLGCPVTLIERSPIVHLLIEDGVQRASLSEKFQPIMQQGFDLINCDAKDYIDERLASVSRIDDSTDNSPDHRPDVIYIDPMYPHRKKSALVKKDMQILQHLHHQDEDSTDLIESALRLARKRVVVKRPVLAGTLSDRKPDTCIKSKKTRYDIYTIEKMR